MRKILFTVTNDLLQDQRMNRICSSLARAGYDITLIGRQRKKSMPLTTQPYRQKRLTCWFQKGKGFYIEYNLRLFIYLLFQKADILCAIDLDTILPVLVVSKLKNTIRVYDAHELFCEMKEVVTRPFIYRWWKKIEEFSVPKFKKGYTVSHPIAEEFKKMYGVEYALIRNMALADESYTRVVPKEKYILYQGAVNEGRSFETLIPAMKDVPVPLIICGDGNFMEQAKLLVQKYSLEEKIIFKGALSPANLLAYTRNATIGVTLFENTGQSNYFSLANRFFDYIQAGVPQVCVNYPAYREINDQYKVAILCHDLCPSSIAAALNNLLSDDVVQNELSMNCLAAGKILNWQEEEKNLFSFYNQLY